MSAVMEPATIDEADIAFLLEAYDNGQFSDDMLDHPSPSCRAPIRPVREALRRHLNRLRHLATQAGDPVVEALHTFIDAAAGEGLILGGIDAAIDADMNASKGADHATR